MAETAFVQEPIGEVYDKIGACYRCRIETKIRRGKPVYRWVLSRKWVSWREWQTGRWTRSENKAWERGRARLMAMDYHAHEVVGRV